MGRQVIPLRDIGIIRGVVLLLQKQEKCANRVCKLKRSIIRIKVTENTDQVITMCQSLCKTNFFNAFCNTMRCIQFSPLYR